MGVAEAEDLSMKMVEVDDLSMKVAEAEDLFLKVAEEEDCSKELAAEDPEEVESEVKLRRETLSERDDSVAEAKDSPLLGAAGKDVF